MLRVTDDILELRCWAEARGARPCRDVGDGHLRLTFPGDSCGAVEVGWDEFEPTFCASRSVFVWDDTPCSRLCFVGNEEEARAWFEAEARAGAAAPAIPG
jgi:hypothetical protein